LIREYLGQVETGITGNRINQTWAVPEDFATLAKKRIRMLFNSVPSDTTDYVT
jgi:hypothetical protein